MIVKLKDGTQINVSSERAEKIKQAVESGAVGIELDDMWFRSDWVVSIMPGATVEPMIRRLPAPDHRGEHSPAKEKLRAKFNN